jgi:hypothetical protein
MILGIHGQGHIQNEKNTFTDQVFPSHHFCLLLVYEFYFIHVTTNIIALNIAWHCAPLLGTRTNSTNDQGVNQWY